MLKNLRIKNYAIIDDLSIDFERGFNVFTGETGAGKSIIVGALSFLLKGRSDSSVIKNGKDKAIIEGVFEIEDENIKKLLAQQDIDYDGELIIKRVMSVDGRNSIRINESSVTLNFLTELLSNYVDIHSQKDSQFLFNKSNQLYLLDKYAKNDQLLSEYKSAYSTYTKIENEYNDLLNNTYNEREIEFYRYDYNELNDADIKIDEEEKLQEIETRSKSSEKYLNVLGSAIGIFYKDFGIKEQLHELINTLNLDDEKVIEEKEKIKDLYYSLTDSIENLDDILKSFDDASYNLEQVEERLYTYSKLKRKHKTDTQGLIDLKDELELKIKAFDDRDRVLSEKMKELNEAKQIALNIAQKLHDNRVDSANILEENIMNETRDLMLNNCSFKINIENTNLNTNGIDNVEYFVSMNKGEELKPLKNVASGGEVSRLMLALKVVFSKDSKTELLILDEIDTGVSGLVGLKMGEKIAKISKNLQTLCITHLSPVAACANAHYYIYKDDVQGFTQTNVRKLDEIEIINELANISNTSTNEKALQAAKELYDSAQNTIQNL